MKAVKESDTIVQGKGFRCVTDMQPWATRLEQA